MSRKIKLMALAVSASCVLALAPLAASAYYDAGYKSFHKHRHHYCGTQSCCHKNAPCHKTNAGCKKKCGCSGK